MFTESLCYIPETTQHSKLTIFNFKNKRYFGGLSAST